MDDVERNMLYLEWIYYHEHCRGERQILCC